MRTRPVINPAGAHRGCEAGKLYELFKGREGLFGPRGSHFDSSTQKHKKPGVVRPTQAGRAAYGPPLPSASIQKMPSARRPPSRAYQHATVRDLVRARAHPPDPTTSKARSPDVHRA